MVNDYTDLIFWKKSFEATKLVVILCRKLPRDNGTNIVVNQLIRACSSIGANIAEGYGKYKGKEYPRFLRIASGSANETDYWLLLLKEMHPRYNIDIEKIKGLITEVRKMLAVTLKKLQIT